MRFGSIAHAQQFTKETRLIVTSSKNSPVGIMSPGSAHIGLGNMSVSLAGAAIFNDSRSRRRPWSLKPDGDLWGLVDVMVQQRNANDDE